MPPNPSPAEAGRPDSLRPMLFQELDDLAMARYCGDAQLFCMAYNIGNFLRRLALPKQIKDWSLRTMREKLVKIGAKVVSHARYVTFQMAVVLVSRSLLHEILERIHRLKPVPIGYG